MTLYVPYVYNTSFNRSQLNVVILSVKYALMNIYYSLKFLLIIFNRNVQHVSNVLENQN